ncbi:hypothetical protein AAYT81_002588 [Yersinia enterocolitica]
MGSVMDKLNKVGGSLSSVQLKVGFLKGATYPDGTSLPMVAAVNEFGNPGNNQPPRPFFRSAISRHSSEWSENVEKLVSSNEGDTEKVLQIMGEVISGHIRESIRELVEPPLSEATIKAKGFSKPLIDTGHMLDSVDYEVTK